MAAKPEAKHSHSADDEARREKAWELAAHFNNPPGDIAKHLADAKAIEEWLREGAKE